MSKKKVLLISLVITIFLIGLPVIFDKFKGGTSVTSKYTERVSTDVSNTITQKSEHEQVNPANVDPTLFANSTAINNKYFNLPVGRKLVYEGDTNEEGKERVEITVPGDTKVILGVTTLIYIDKVWLDDELVEYTKDYLAQDIYGNVWYFGEDVNNYEDGVLKDHEGAWLAGVDGAQPGIWIKSTHITGDSYKQEYYQGKAEDMRDVSSVGEPLKVRMGSYTDCIKMYDWTPLDKDSREFKHYCSEVGAMVLETKPNTSERLELIKIE